MKKWPAEGKSAGHFLHIGCILACFGIRAGFVLEFAPRHLGSKNIPRVKKTFRLLLICCVSGSFLIWLLCMTVPGAVASIFTNDAVLIDYTRWSMRVYLPMLLIYGIRVACQYSFVALDQAPKAIFLTVWRKIILLIPLIFFLPHIWPDAVTGVYLAEPIADTIAICTTAPMFYAYYRKLK